MFSQCSNSASAKCYSCEWPKHLTRLLVNHDAAHVPIASNPSPVVYVGASALARRGHLPSPTPAEVDASPSIFPRRMLRGASIQFLYVFTTRICVVASTCTSRKLPLRRRPAAIVFLSNRSGFEREPLKGSCDVSSNQAFLRTPIEREHGHVGGEAGAVEVSRPSVTKKGWISMLLRGPNAT